MTLDRADLEAIAQLVGEQLPGALPPRLLRAEEVAERLGVERSWVYEHARELGARRLGDGSKPRLRFAWADVLAAFPREPSKGSDRPQTGIARRLRRARSRPSVPLVPVRGPVVPKPVEGGHS